MIGKLLSLNGIGGIEKGLDNLMTPIDPDPEFVRNLGTKLRFPKSVTIEQYYDTKSTSLFLLIAGMILGIITVFLLRKLR
jgi:hypothetical protein